MPKGGLDRCIMATEKVSLLQILGILTKDELCQHSLSSGRKKHETLTHVLCRELLLEEDKEQEVREVSQKQKKPKEQINLEISPKVVEILDSFYQDYLKTKDAAFFSRVKPKKSKMLDKIIAMPNFILKEKKKFKKVYREIKRKEIFDSYINNAKSLISSSKRITLVEKKQQKMEGKKDSD